MLIGRLLTINPDKVKNFDLLDSMETITIGRNSSCTLQLGDSRCSSVHCKIYLNKVRNEWEIEIEDLSTNGTFIDNVKVIYKQIGKSKKVKASWGSQIDILRVPQVDESSKIGFKFDRISPEATEKRKPDDSSSEKKAKSSEESKSDMNNQVLDTLKCQICFELMYQPISLYPCLHNFCGGCFSDWYARAKDCPTCRIVVTEVKKNHMVVTLIDAFKKNNPKCERDKDELDELDKANIFKQDRTVLNVTRSIKSDGSASSSEDDVQVPVNARGRGRGKVAARPTPVRQQAVQSICKQCSKAVEGYKCVPNQAHIQCFACKAFMPDRNANQKCQICDRGYCNLYWKTGKCRVGIMPIDSYKSTVFTAIRPSSINENKYEQNVTAEYIRKKSLNMNIVSQEMMDAMEANKWDVNLSKS